jgi:hypothetical protein
MKKINLFIILIFLLIIYPVSITARENSKIEKLIFTTITIPSSGIPESLSGNISMTIQNHLKDEDFFVINSNYTKTEGITFPGCLKKQCIDKLKAVTSGGIIILVSVSTEVVKIGEKHISRYAVEDITETRYTIYAASVDQLNEKYDLQFTKTFTDTAKLIDEADRIGIKIRDFYIKRKPEKKVKNIENGNKNITQDYFDITGISLSLSTLYPSGKFTDISDYGYGAEIMLSGSSVLIPFITFNPGLSIYKLNPSSDNISSAYIFLPEISIGYNFNITDSINFTPLVGFGYSIMLIDGQTDNNPGSKTENIYYNPIFKGGAELSYSITKDYSFIFDASYNCIAEQSSVLLFSSFNMGIRMNLK